MQKKLEVIAFNVQSCHDAALAGAHRIELCDNPSEGGTTPSYGFIKAARAQASIELYPIIRPRGGDFLYSDDEFNIMKDDIRVCRQLGCDGVVIGMITADGRIDKDRCARLVELAYPMGVTFHRAFDRTRDLFESLEDTISIGCERILTSGGVPSAMDRIETLAQLITTAEERIIIMPGSGIRASNIAALAKKTGAVEFHSSARKATPSLMQYHATSMQEELKSFSLDTEEVANMLAALNG